MIDGVAAFAVNVKESDAVSYMTGLILLVLSFALLFACGVSRARNSR